MGSKEKGLSVTDDGKNHVFFINAWRSIFNVKPTETYLNLSPVEIAWSRVRRNSGILAEIMTSFDLIIMVWL